MNSKLIKLLVSVCISLCLIIAVEWLYASYMRHRLLTSILSAKPQNYKADELPTIALAKQPEDSYVDLVTRPLFIKGRRAVDEVRPETAQGGGTKLESFDWQLNGVYSTKKTTLALFGRSRSKVAKDNYRKITVGDDLDGWKLIEISRDRALLKQGTNEKELLLRKPKLKALPPGANRPSPFSQAPASAPSPFSQPPVPAPAPAPAPVPAANPEPPADTTGDTSESNR
ncbi:hypothetical protein [Methylobacter sp.]|uniref:hypothetical protein n=1 Tax=Methylobacter sp. TaxID=2051955 RepID=UPI002FDD7797